MHPLTISPVGDSALLIELGNSIDLALNQRVHALARQLQAAQLPGICAIVPAYANLLVHYDPLLLDYEQVEHWALAMIEQPTAQLGAAVTRCIEIPVHYGGEAGPDLAHVAAHCGLSEAEVIARHSNAIYQVYMMGFTPGFAYLGGLDPTLATPRLATPRVRVPAGAVGIAGNQTGIYPVASPGGWQLIGQTPLHLFDPQADPPTLLAPGDEVRFVAQ